MNIFDALKGGMKNDVAKDWEKEDAAALESAWDSIESKLPTPPVPEAMEALKNAFQLGFQMGTVHMGKRIISVLGDMKEKVSERKGAK